MAKKWKMPFLNGRPLFWASNPNRSWYGSGDSNKIRTLFAGETREQLVGENEIEWRDNNGFEATLTVLEVERGRSAAHFLAEDEGRAKFVIFAIDLLEALQSVGCQPGAKIKGRWMFCKRGMNYGVQLVKE